MHHIKSWLQGSGSDQEPSAQRNSRDDSHSESLECEVCGGISSHRCPDCQNKIFCSDCEQEWHGHPLRKGHKCVVLGALRRSNFQPLVEVQGTVKERLRAFTGDSGQGEGEPAHAVPRQSAVQGCPMQETGGSQVQNNTNLRVHSTSGRNVTSDSRNDTSKQPSSSRLSTTPTSEIVLRLDNLPSLEQKQHEFRKELETVKRKIERCDLEIENGFEEDPDFDGTDAYQQLSKRKTFLTKEKVQIQQFGKSLSGQQRPEDLVKSHSKTGGFPPELKMTPPSLSPELGLSLSSTRGQGQAELDTATERGQVVTHPSSERSPRTAAVKKQIVKKNEGKKWICSHCTLLNDAGVDVCEACYQRTSDPEIMYAEEIVEGVIEESSTAGADVMGAGAAEASMIGAGTAETSVMGGPPDLDTTGSMFCDIAAEKQKAWEKFNEKERLREQGVHVPDEYEGDSEAGLSSTAQVPEPHQSMFVDEAARKERARQEWEKKKLRGAGNPGGEQKLDTREPKKMVKVKSLRETTAFNVTRREKTSPLPQVNEDEYQYLAALKEQASQVTKLYKWAENNGLALVDVDLAILLDVGNPRVWLTSILPQEADSLAAELRAAGMAVSLTVAKEAYVTCVGDRELAVTYLQNYCHKMEIKLQDSFQSHFSKEEVHVACTNHMYIEDDVVDDLCRQVCAGFIQRLQERQQQDATFDPQDIYSLDLDPKLQALLSNKSESKERRARAVLIEHSLQGWGRAEMIVELIDELVTNGEGVTADDVVRIVKQHGFITKEEARQRLQEECVMCYGDFPPRQITTLSLCQCKLCRECLKGHFEVTIREKHIKHLPCPSCQTPDLQNGQQEDMDNYFQFLAVQLPTLVNPEILELYHSKLNGWKMQSDEKFRWCSNDKCQNGFVWERPSLKMKCEKCSKHTCFNCKRAWLPQHDGVSCEQFKQWLEENDPEYQAHGLAKHLELNGIACPNCSFRYALAKGGCMHFKCTQCGHEFCCGCNQPFIKQGICQKFRVCVSAGLHCHHPRDCLYYLRDKTVEELKGLLQETDFATAEPEENMTTDRCTVMEQKETQEGLKDEQCGKEVYDNSAQLCENHYKEYLVSIVNRKKIDPLPIMELQELKIVFTRCDRQAPKQNKNETAAAYRERLTTIIKKDFPLETSADVNDCDAGL